MKAKVQAILCSDLHLSHTAPSIRSLKVPWYEVMEFYLNQLTALQTKYECPVIIAGDVFDHWDSSPELINFAMDKLPKRLHAIPGQHDLPNHSYNEMYRSAYGSLVRSETIRNIRSRRELGPWELQHTKASGELALYGFPWETKLQPFSDCKGNKDRINIAIIHQYIWTGEHKFPTAPMTCQAGRIARQLKGFDIVVAGDNHKGFLFKAADASLPLVLNCGTFIRRTAPEIEYKPSIWLLTKDLIIQRKYLDTSIDSFITKEQQQVKKEDIDKLNQWMTSLADLLEAGSSSSIDIIEVLKRRIESDDVRAQTKEYVLEAMDASRDQ